MTRITAARNPNVIHTPTQEGAGIGMTHFARLLCWEVIRWLTHHPERLPIVTSQTIASDSAVVVALYQEGGRTDVTGIACTAGHHMVIGSGFCRNSRTGRVATRAIFGGVLENAIDVTLFAL
jgi:hypothetical protein